ncbi:MAG: Formyl-coenzyme A transferase [Pelotomaculum sp. PtaB.Bin104]|nr:MAG: Formyl-coenzyme A transferase [Pelotomaculum sp. PtaB.Bin104]
MTMPLKGIRVLDLSRLLPGPFCSMILADMGAEVLKIEDTDRGDYMRQTGTINKKESMYFLSLNRNKKSMKLNLKSEYGKEIFNKLVQQYDVILEQFRPGVMERLGLGYDDLKKINPKIIYCSLTGYGQYGPYRDMAGHDINYLSITGVLDSIGIRNGPPVIPGIQFADIAGGSLWAAIGILIAIVGRDRTGIGQFLDVAMSDGVLPFHSLFGASYFVNGQVPRRGETRQSGLYAFYNIYETKDGLYVSLGASESKFWSGFCTAIGRPDLSSEQHAPEPRQSEIINEVQRIIKTKTQAEWIESLKTMDICFTPVKNIGEALADPHVQSRKMVVEMDHPVEGKISTLAFPVKFSQTPARVSSPPPLYGEHTLDILKMLGYDDEQIKELQKFKVI